MLKPTFEVKCKNCNYVAQWRSFDLADQDLKNHATMTKHVNVSLGGIE